MGVGDGGVHYYVTYTTCHRHYLSPTLLSLENRDELPENPSSIVSSTIPRGNPYPKDQRVTVGRSTVHPCSAMSECDPRTTKPLEGKSVSILRAPVRIARRDDVGLQLRRPWRVITRPGNPELCCTLTSRNYKVYADVGFNRYRLTRKISILDTGAGANFIGKSELDSEWESHIRYGPLPNVCDANNKPLKAMGIITQVVRLGHFIVENDFIVCDTRCRSCAGRSVHGQVPRGYPSS